MDYVNTYAATLPLHTRGFYDTMLVVSTEEVRFDQDIARKITTQQLGERMIWYTGLPTAQPLRDGENSPRATPTTPYNKWWYTQLYGMAVVFTEKQVDTDRSGLINQAAKHLGISQWNAYQNMVAGLIDNSTSSSYLGPDAKSLAASDHPIANGRSYSNLSTPQTFSPDALQQMLSDVKGQRTWWDEPWVETRGYNLITGYTLELKAQEVLTATMGKAHEFSNTPNVTQEGKKAGTATIYRTQGNPYLVDTNLFALVPTGDKNPLFILERKGVQIRYEDNVNYRQIWNSQADRTVGWVHPWGVQVNEGA